IQSGNPSTQPVYTKRRGVPPFSCDSRGESRPDAGQRATLISGGKIIRTSRPPPPYVTAASYFAIALSDPNIGFAEEAAPRSNRNREHYNETTMRNLVGREKSPKPLCGS